MIGPPRTKTMATIARVYEGVSELSTRDQNVGEGIAGGSRQQPDYFGSAAVMTCDRDRFRAIASGMCSGVKAPLFRSWAIYLGGKIWRVRKVEFRIITRWRHMDAVRRLRVERGPTLYLFTILLPRAYLYWIYCDGKKQNI